MLEIRDLHASVNDTPILRGVNLSVQAGEVHAVMGPNGSGKSTLAFVLAGKPGYVVTQGTALYQGQDLLKMMPEDRARAGVFLSFQHPVEVPGVRLDQFLRAGYNAVNKSRGLEELDPLKFDRLLRRRIKSVNVDPQMTRRSVNEGFSGRARRSATRSSRWPSWKPKLAILDEPDSGLDVDALRSVAQSINGLRNSENALLLVTHYQRILNHVVPDRVHVLVNGRIVKSGGKELALEIEANGYDGYEKDAESSLQSTLSQPASP